MAFPTVADADSKTGVVNSNSDPWVINYPTNIAAGDLLLLFLGIDGNPTPSAADWTLLLSHNSTTTIRIAVLGKVATGSETGTFTLSLGDSQRGGWYCVRIPANTWYGGTLSAGTTTNASDGVSGNASSPDATNNPNPPSRSPAWGAADTLWFAFAAIDRGLTDTPITGYPTDYTNTGNQLSNGAGGAGLAYARRERNIATEDPGEFSYSGSTSIWIAGTLAIRPAAPIGGSFTADAVVQKGIGASAALDAVVRRTIESSATLDAVTAGVALSFTVDAIVRQSIGALAFLDATALATRVGAASLDAETIIGGHLTLDAWVLGGRHQHHRQRDHFGADLDLYVAISEPLGPWNAGTPVKYVIADLYDRITRLASYDHNVRVAKLDAYVLAPSSDSGGLGLKWLDAIVFVSQSGSFTLDAERGLVASVTLDAYVHGGAQIHLNAFVI